MSSPWRTHPLQPRTPAVPRHYLPRALHCDPRHPTDPPFRDSPSACSTHGLDRCRRFAPCCCYTWSRGCCESSKHCHRRQRRQTFPCERPLPLPSKGPRCRTPSGRCLYMRTTGPRCSGEPRRTSRVPAWRQAGSRRPTSTTAWASAITLLSGACCGGTRGVARRACSRFFSRFFSFFFFVFFFRFLSSCLLISLFSCFLVCVCTTQSGIPVHLASISEQRVSGSSAGHDNHRPSPNKVYLRRSRTHLRGEKHSTFPHPQPRARGMPRAIQRGWRGVQLNPSPRHRFIFRPTTHA